VHPLHIQTIRLTTSQKNFPEEYESLQPELERYFARFGVINAVRMRRKDDKSFKSSVFCEFSEVESAQRFLDGTKREFKGVELTVMSK
jgi:lupus La protein